MLMWQALYLLLRLPMTFTFELYDAYHEIYNLMYVKSAHFKHK